MKIIIALIALLFMGSAVAMAQDTDHPPRGLGYVFVGGGTHSMGLTTGFGGERYVIKGLGLGAELGAAGVIGDSNKLIGVGSADASYHFFPKKIRGNAAPFLTGGYSNFFGHNTHTGTGFWGHKPLMTQGFNLGGGVDLFAKKHLGVRFEVRYYGHGGRILNYTFPNLDQFSFVAFRIGLTFRSDVGRSESTRDRPATDWNNVERRQLDLAGVRRVGRRSRSCDANCGMALGLSRSPAPIAGQQPHPVPAQGTSLQESRNSQTLCILRS
jgi:opacity protein-like surface antigen